MRLAAEFGCYDVDAMLERMTSQQFDEWCAFYKLEPLGNESVKVAIANAAACICRSLGNSEVQPWEILGRDDPTETVSPNQAAAAFRGRG